VEQLARSTRDVVEVRIDGARVGQLTPRMSGELLPAIHHLSEHGEVTAARAIIKGNRIKAEVVLYVVRAHELPESWLGSAQSPIPPALVAAPAPQREHAPVPPPPTGIRFTVPPDWPQPPAGWVPPQGWRPDASWPAAPDDWQWWTPVWE
jgi:collagen type III alpha